MNKATMTITINKEGRITSDIKGLKGKGCTDVDSFLNELGVVVDEAKTREYSEQKIQNQRIVTNA